MIFTIGLFLAIIGLVIWRLDLRSPTRDQLQRNGLGQIIIAPTTFGLLSFMVGIIGVLMVMVSIGMLLWKAMP